MVVAASNLPVSHSWYIKAINFQFWAGIWHKMIQSNRADTYSTGVALWYNFFCAQITVHISISYTPSINYLCHFWPHTFPLHNFRHRAVTLHLTTRHCCACPYTEVKQQPQQNALNMFTTRYAGCLLLLSSHPWPVPKIHFTKFCWFTDLNMYVYILLCTVVKTNCFTSLAVCDTMPVEDWCQ